MIIQAYQAELESLAVKLEEENEALLKVKVARLITYSLCFAFHNSGYKQF